MSQIGHISTANLTRIVLLAVILTLTSGVNSCSKGVGSGEGWGGHSGAADERN
jgi:hypothetical protein